MSLLLGVALLIQAQTAEETFKTIGETIGNAKTIQLTFTLEIVVSYLYGRLQVLATVA